VAFWAKDLPTDDDERRETERDDVNVWGERLPIARLRLLDLASGAVRTIEALGDRHVREAAPRPDGAMLAVLTWSMPVDDPGSLDGRIHLVDGDALTARQLGAEVVGARQLTWRRAGDWRLLYLASPPPHFTTGYALVETTVPDNKDREPVRRNLSEGIAACPIEIVAVRDAATMVAFADGLDTTLMRIDGSEGALVPVGRVDGPLGSISASDDGRLVAAVHSTPRHGNEVWTGPPAGPLRPLTKLNPALDGIAWGAQERLQWRAADGLELDGLLILPPGQTRADGPFPMVTLPHGGPYGRYADGFQLVWAPSGQWLATAGFAVFLPNPRGGMGNGSAFAHAVAGAVGMEDWQDIVAGVDLLIDQGVADPDRLGIGGWSQGGFMTAWAVGQTDRFKAGVMGAGVSDWGMMVAGSDLPSFEGALGGSTGWEGVGPHRHDALSPISFAANATTPLLILHGERDERVPVHQGQFFFRALRAHGVECEFAVYPREPHGLRERAHQIDCLNRTRAWFRRWLIDDDQPGERS
jgi:dienelactone hydrolase